MDEDGTYQGVGPGPPVITTLNVAPNRRVPLLSLRNILKETYTHVRELFTCLSRYEALGFKSSGYPRNVCCGCELAMYTKRVPDRDTYSRDAV